MRLFMVLITFLAMLATGIAAGITKHEGNYLLMTVNILLFGVNLVMFYAWLFHPPQRFE